VTSAVGSGASLVPAFGGAAFWGPVGLGIAAASVCCLDRIGWFAVELDEMLCLRIEPVPTPQMGQQTQRNRDLVDAYWFSRGPVCGGSIDRALEAAA
jgi:hypothetical protein